MNSYNYNEMFILALVALSIIGVVCLGLLIILALFVLVRKGEKEQRANLPSNGSSSSINPAHNQGKEESNLTVGDWVTFLTSEKYGVMGSTFNLFSILVALFGIVFVARTLTSILDTVFIVLFGGYIAYVIYFGVVKRFRQLGRLASDILDKIMEDKLRNPKDIENLWAEGVKQFKNKRQKQK